MYVLQILEYAFTLNIHKVYTINYVFINFILFLIVLFFFLKGILIIYRILTHGHVK